MFFRAGNDPCIAAQQQNASGESVAAQSKVWYNDKQKLTVLEGGANGSRQEETNLNFEPLSSKSHKI